MSVYVCYYYCIWFTLISSFENSTFSKVQKIEAGTISNEDVQLYKEKISKLDGVVFNGADVNVNKRIITIRIGNKENELTLVNPKIIQTSERPVVYYETDTYKPNKIRKTVRHPYLVIDTDNLGKVEFKANNEFNDWKGADDFFGDVGLLECVLVQRAIDSIDGIDITHVSRAYSETVVKDKQTGRNERVMLQGPNGEMEFVKSKKVDSYLTKGWNLI